MIEFNWLNNRLTILDDNFGGNTSEKDWKYQTYALWGNWLFFIMRYKYRLADVFCLSIDKLCIIARNDNVIISYANYHCLVEDVYSSYVCLYICCLLLMWMFRLKIAVSLLFCGVFDRRVLFRWRNTSIICKT